MAKVYIAPAAYRSIPDVITSETLTTAARLSAGPVSRSISFEQIAMCKRKEKIEEKNR